MKIRTYVKAFLVGSMILAASSAWSQDEPGPIAVAEPLAYVRIFSGPDGESHFEDGRFSFTLVDFSPPAPPISVSDLLPAESVAVISSPPGWHGDWHPAPCQQLMFVLAGELEVRVSDGEVRRFRPGAILLVEDTVGKGHVSTVVGEQRGFMASIPLRDAEAGEAARGQMEADQSKSTATHVETTPSYQNKN
jgi:quercetin dioxygenase-like cupin family protein